MFSWLLPVERNIGSGIYVLCCLWMGPSSAVKFWVWNSSDEHFCVWYTLPLPSPPPRKKEEKKERTNSDQNKKTKQNKLVNKIKERTKYNKAKVSFLYWHNSHHHCHYQHIIIIIIIIIITTIIIIKSYHHHHHNHYESLLIRMLLTPRRSILCSRLKTIPTLLAFQKCSPMDPWLSWCSNACCPTFQRSYANQSTP